jgi:hypothetical protein
MARRHHILSTTFVDGGTSFLARSRLRKMIAKEPVAALPGALSLHGARLGRLRRGR